MAGSEQNPQNPQSGAGRRQGPDPSGKDGQEALLTRPRWSAVIGSLILGLLFLAASAATWWAGVRTYHGQKFDDWVWNSFDRTYARANALNRLFANSHLVIGLCGAIVVLSVLVAALRRRWRLILQIGIFGALAFLVAFGLKRVLPRPVLDTTISNPQNSAPSGHTALMMAAGVILVMAMPRVLRGLSSLVASLLVLLVAFSVISDKWHRPTDVIMAILLIAGLALIVLAFTRGSGMDAPGKRASSPSLQIIATIMISLGVMMLAATAYMVWQLWPSITVEALAYTRQVNVTSMLSMGGSAFLSFGILACMRQATASPLSRAGLVGAPPAPPKEW